MNRYGTIAFIPVRGGSKSIPLKNIKPINGRPLVYWVLDAAVHCAGIDKVFVSTDHDRIRETVLRYGSPKIEVVGRSAETAGDRSSTESAMLEFAPQAAFDRIILIQATSPLLEARHLDAGIALMDTGKYDSVLSVTRQKRFIWRQDADGYAQPQNYDYRHRPMRQQFGGFLVENGAFYITTRQRLLETNLRISGRIGLVEMEEESYFELDEPADWIIVEQFLQRKNANPGNWKPLLQNIKLVVTDSDGVLTDGGMYYSENGDELKKFNTRDGMGVQLLREHGIKTVIMTGEDVELVRRRGRKMNVEAVYTGIKNKAELVRKLAEQYEIGLEQIAFIGDDINDLEAVQTVGFGCSVADGMEQVKRAAKYVTKAEGGKGALRELAELIIHSRT